MEAWEILCSFTHISAIKRAKMGAPQRMFMVVFGAWHRMHGSL